MLSGLRRGLVLGLASMSLLASALGASACSPAGRFYGWEGVAVVHRLDTGAENSFRFGGAGVEPDCSLGNPIEVSGQTVFVSTWQGTLEYDLGGNQIGEMNRSFFSISGGWLYSFSDGTKSISRENVSTGATGYISLALPHSDLEIRDARASSSYIALNLWGRASWDRLMIIDAVKGAIVADLAEVNGSIGSVRSSTIWLLEFEGDTLVLATSNATGQAVHYYSVTSNYSWRVPGLGFIRSLALEGGAYYYGASGGLWRLDIASGESKIVAKDAWVQQIGANANLVVYAYVRGADPPIYEDLRFLIAVAAFLVGIVLGIRFIRRRRKGLSRSKALGGRLDRSARNRGRDVVQK